MDNFTHSLMGAALAQGAIQYRLYKQSQRSKATPTTTASPETTTATSIAALPMMVTSILANNFPDSDLLVTAFMDPKLGYILHHRGHTHTLLFTLVQPLLLLGALWLYQRWQKTSWNQADWRWLFGLAFVGGVVHLGMDSWNVYGVHPFWPLNNHWYYGDFVFIIEPLFWVALIPWLYCSVEKRWSKNTFIVAYSLGYIALFAVYFSIFWYPLFLLVVGLSYGYWVLKRKSQVTRAWASFAAMLLILGSLLGSSAWLKTILKDALHQQDPQEKVADIALMSYPSNPFCYQWISVGHQTQNKDYVMRKGLYSFLPRLLPCPDIISETTATLQDAPRLVTKIGGLIGKQQIFRRPLKELRDLKGHCQLEAAMQFIRTPSWKITANSFFIGDLRFDRRKAYDLAEFQFPRKPRMCPTLRPPWIAPLTKDGLW
ncbi:MAG: metal-dependent hydrolase [Myxococcales bacterium]|nr:metal-dependent hydrolase [Myxococcales bacterium]MCB9643533.1 metal-dependent hydrolase [Myxococcales bacterium]